MNYSKLIKDLTAEMKKGVQYARIPSPYKIFLIVAMIPFIVSFILSKLTYWITLFFYKMISAPADYLSGWLKGQKDEVHHATQAVMYFICLPFIFFLQILLSISALTFFFQWFFLMIQGYILTLGGIKWQPFITEAKFEDDGTEYTLKPDLTVSTIFACVVGGIFALWLLIFIIDLFVNAAFLSTITSFLFYLYLIFVCIVNPCIFKRIPKK